MDIDIKMILILTSVVLNITFHEFMHGWTAHRIGDPTPARQKRLTLNPIAHFDIMGVICLIVTKGAFGWGKPVEVDPRYFRKPRRDNFLISAAGPFTNMAIFLVSAGCYHLLSYLGTIEILPKGSTPVGVAKLFLIINCMIALSLGIFNLLPIYPLDGSHILESLAPRSWRPLVNYLHQYGSYILIFLIMAEVFMDRPFILSGIIRFLVPSILNIFGM